MSKSSLPLSWVRWRRRRYQTLSAQGMASHLAWLIAAGEAKGRHRISKIVGKQAAMEADLECVSVGGSLRFMLVGDAATLSEAQTQNITKMAA